MDACLGFVAVRVMTLTLRDGHSTGAALRAALQKTVSSPYTALPYTHRKETDT